MAVTRVTCTVDTRVLATTASGVTPIELRWRCSCGRTGLWRTEPRSFPRVEVVRLWWKHVRDFHPECLDPPTTAAHFNRRRRVERVLDT